MNPHKILQLIPAVGWYAQHEFDCDEGEVTEHPLAAWALVEWEGREAHEKPSDLSRFQSVEGVEMSSTETVLSVEMDSLVGYVYRPLGPVEPKKKDPRSLPVSELYQYFSGPRSGNALRVAKCETVGDVEKLGWERLVSFKNVGMKTIDEIREAMAKVGVRF